MDVHLVELIDYLRVLRRRLVLMLVIVVACVGGAAVATVLQTKTYQAHIQLIVNGSSNLSAQDEISLRQLATERAVAYGQIATTTPAVNAAVARANSLQGPFTSGGSLSVAATANGSDPFLSVTVTSSDPREAQAVANAYAKILPVVLAKLGQSSAQVPEDISTLQIAGLPTSPSSPKLEVNLLIGLAVGLVLALLAAFVRDALDRRLRDSDEVERATKVPVLGVVPTELPKSHVPVITEPTSARAEAYRKVRANLMFASADGFPKSLLVTSAVSGEGKTTLAINLAMACARTGQRVALVDADLRRPMIADYLELEDSKGLTNVLAGELTLAEALAPTSDARVTVLKSGSIPTNPSELLGSAQMRDLLNELVSQHDVVIIDAPPVLPIADALVLAVQVEGIVLVAKIGDTTLRRLTDARDAVNRVNGTLVGIVPNAVIRREDSAYAYAYRDRGHGKAGAMASYVDIARTPQIEVEPGPSAEGAVEPESAVEVAVESESAVEVAEAEAEAEAEADNATPASVAPVTPAPVAPAAPPARRSATTMIARGPADIAPELGEQLSAFPETFVPDSGDAERQ